MAADRLRQCALVGHAPAIAVACSLIAPLISTNGLYGLEYGSYVWRGSGLFTQALAMHLLMLSIGQVYRVMGGKGSGVAGGLLVGATFLGHFLYGCIAAVSAVLAAIVTPGVHRKVLVFRLTVIGATAMALTSFQLIPMVLDLPFINHSRWEPAWKWDSFGAPRVLQMLVKGELMDYGRFPLLTLLVLAGTLVCVIPRLRDKLPTVLPTFVLSGGVFWLAMFFGRPTWGFLMDFLARDLPLHRLIGAVHVFAILLAGIGLGTLWHGLVRNVAAAGRIVAVLMVAALLLPAVLERREFLEKNRQWGEASIKSFETEKSDIDRTLKFAQTQFGRLYPGLAAGWGSQFRVGSVPFSAILSENHIPAVAFLYHAMALTSDIMVLFDEWNPSHYRLFNVTNVAAEASRTLPPFVGPSETFGRFQIARAPGNGYFDVVSVPYTTATDKYGFFEINSRWLHSSWVAGRQHLLLDFGGGSPAGMARLRPSDILPPLAPEKAGQVESEQHDHETYSAVLTLNRPAYALFKMTYHPNWRASVDGKERSTVMLSPGFIGVGMDAGRHEIELRYEPGMMKTELLIAGILVLLTLAVVERSGATMRLEKRLQAARFLAKRHRAY